ncbi:unnamed protein product [Penicillium glandicola]
MKFTAALGLAALFMAPSAMAWKLPHIYQADDATPTGPASSGFPGGFPSGTPTAFPSAFPSGHGGGHGGSGHNEPRSEGGHGRHGGHRGQGHASSGVASAYPEATGTPAGSPNGYFLSQASGSFTAVPTASATPAAFAGDDKGASGEKGGFPRVHARHMLF